MVDLRCAGQEWYKCCFCCSCPVLVCCPDAMHGRQRSCARSAEGLLLVSDVVPVWAPSAVLRTVVCIYSVFKSNVSVNFSASQADEPCLCAGISVAIIVCHGCYLRAGCWMCVEIKPLNRTWTLSESGCPSLARREPHVPKWGIVGTNRKEGSPAAGVNLLMLLLVRIAIIDI